MIFLSSLRQINMKTIKQLEKEIKFEDENAGSYVGIQELKAKLQTLKEVLKEIDKMIKTFKAMGKYDEDDMNTAYTLEELKAKLVGE